MPDERRCLERVDSPDRFGVYVHIPFCASRCDYCAFATWTDKAHLVGTYVEACATAAARMADDGRPATSVFFGGGTPSLLDAGLLESILERIPMSVDTEVTVECNPESVDFAKLASYRRAGVTRLSFGVQSMRPHVLASLGRRHDPDSVRRALSAAGEAGFADAINVDLIMGAVGESLSDWDATLEAVLCLEPSPVHVSAYGLTIEPGTPLARDVSRHPDPDDQADKYLLADDRLADAGLYWYEISNWAKPGAQCRHNQLYWAQGEYLGIGCAAHSHRVDAVAGTARRWWNVRTPERYVSLVGFGGDGEASGEHLDASQRRTESLVLGLRTASGVAEVHLPGWREDPVLAHLVEPAGPGRVALTREGRLLANEVALRLVDMDEGRCQVAETDGAPRQPVGSAIRSPA